MQFFLSLEHFLPSIKGKSICIRSDNATAVSYLNKMGGTRSRSLCYIALKIWNLLIDNSISCSAFHIAGASNIEADFYSRFSNLHEFSLNSNAFLSLCKIIPFKLEIDLFASKENNKLEN